MMPIAVGFVALLVLGILGKLGLSPQLALVVGPLLIVAGVAVILARDLRAHPAGTLRLEAGRLICDAWASAKWDVPVEDVRVVRRDDGAVLPVLAVHFARGPTLYVHQARVAEPLVEIEAAIFEHLGLPDGSKARAATARETAMAYGHVMRRRWWVIAAAVVLFGLMSWIASRGAP